MIVILRRLLWSSIVAIMVLWVTGMANGAARFDRAGDLKRLGLYKFNGNAVDECGLNDEFQLVKTEFIDNSLYLDGKSSQASVSIKPLDYKNFTIALDVLPMSTGYSMRIITAGTTKLWWLILGYGDEGMLNLLWRDGHRTKVKSVCVLKANNWHTIVASIDLNTGRVMLCIDGELKHLSVGVWSTFDLLEKWRDGGNVFSFVGDRNWKLFHGNVDNIRFFGKSMSADEMKNLPHPKYDQTLPREDAHPRQPRVPEVPKSGFNFEFRYPDDFPDAAKAEIVEAGHFLASYILDDHTVAVSLESDPNITAFAAAAPDLWKVDTPEKSIVDTASIAFNPESINNVAQSSIFALTVHELMHCLGVPSAKAFKSKVQKNQFIGVKTMALNGGWKVPLQDNNTHVKAYYKDPLGVGPRISAYGTGKIISAIDLGILYDIGYKVRFKAGNKPRFIDVKLDGRYYRKHMPGPHGPINLITGMGGNDVLRAGSGQTILAGLGGSDVLITGAGLTKMQGGNDRLNNLGEDGADTFYIKTGGVTHQILDFEARDKILISPSLGVEKSQIDGATITNDGSYSYRNHRKYYTYTLSVGVFSLKIASPTEPSTDKILVQDWQPKHRLVVGF
jgi:hypothetical protein